MNKQYSVILADPPWWYDWAWGNGAAAHHYPCMKTDEICGLDVASVAARDCTLFMWGTWPLLPDAMRVIEAWGFTYKTMGFVWLKQYPKSDKLVFGCGQWTRGNTEPCFIATRGKPKRVNASVFQVIQTRRRAHSQKPDEQYGLIEQLMGDVPRLELFARQAWPGWAAWGNQVDSGDVIIPARVDVPLRLATGRGPRRKSA